jgi:Icc-related predicted phosphoesterase
LRGRPCLFVSDLHGREARYEALFREIGARAPSAVFLGGDLLPHRLSRRRASGEEAFDFVQDVIAAGFRRLRAALGEAYPRVFAILGNDDPRCEEEDFAAAGAGGLFEYLHGRRVEWNGRDVYGYACVPPTPFRLKDWERYDVSRFVDPGCSAPEDGWHTAPFDERDARLGTIREDLERLAGERDLSDAIFLFHTPPYRTALDRAALDGKKVDHVPLDVHIGSIAVRRFVEARAPAVTLHGHVHESARITGGWSDRIGATVALSAAHDGPELALVSFDPSNPAAATRELLLP